MVMVYMLIYAGCECCRSRSTAQSVPYDVVRLFSFSPTYLTLLS